MTKSAKIFFGIFFFGVFCFYINFFSPFVMPWYREEAIEATLSWGELQKLPKDADITHLEKRGSMFTRQFIIEFTCSDSQIKKWMQESKGFKNSKIKVKDGTIIYEIHPKKGAYGGRVKINGNRVVIDMIWS
ncbi:hypothetical protein [Flavobacterium panacagri]|uniref:hypothetical protein n=1 Tax=Flavobacterium panacagri TaxID=3034146 RepID=UPI0025A56098|nr:hypothetical protein [Flavobacterium panacagri]